MLSTCAMRIFWTTPSPPELSVFPEAQRKRICVHALRKVLVNARHGWGSRYAALAVLSVQLLGIFFSRSLGRGNWWWDWRIYLLSVRHSLHA